MFAKFKTGHFSMTGQAHRLAGLENQDSGLCELREHSVLLAVSDGVSSAEDSKVGSMLLTRAIRRLIVDVEQQLLAFAEKMSPVEFAGRFVAWLNRELQGELTKARWYLGGDEQAASSLSATLLGALITETSLVAFACGDGVIAVNGEMFSVVSPKENCPDLPVYAISALPGVDSRMPLGTIRPIYVGRTAEIDSLVLGTDGVVELLPLLVKGGSLDMEALIARSLAVSSTMVQPKDDHTIVGAFRIS